MELKCKIVTIHTVDPTYVETLQEKTVQQAMRSDL